MPQHDDAMLELAELYAIGGLETDDRATLERHLAQCASCRAAVAQGRLVAYALAASVAEPAPAGLRARVLAGIGKRPTASVTTLIPVWRRPGWLAAAAAIVVLVFAGTWAVQRWSTSTRSWAVNCPAGVSTAPCPDGRVVSAGANALRLEGHGFAALPAGKVYQAWYIRRGGAPVPAPTFTPDARGNATVELPVGAEKGLTVAVTVEPEGGSQAPTTKPFLIAAID